MTRIRNPGSKKISNLIEPNDLSALQHVRKQQKLDQKIEKRARILEFAFPFIVGVLGMVAAILTGVDAIF